MDSLTSDVTAAWWSAVAHWQAGLALAAVAVIAATVAGVRDHRAARRRGRSS